MAQCICYAGTLQASTDFAFDSTRPAKVWFNNALGSAQYLHLKVRALSPSITAKWQRFTGGQGVSPLGCVTLNYWLYGTKYTRNHVCAPLLVQQGWETPHSFSRFEFAIRIRNSRFPHSSRQTPTRLALLQPRFRFCAGEGGRAISPRCANGTSGTRRQLQPHRQSATSRPGRHDR